MRPLPERWVPHERYPDLYCHTTEPLLTIGEKFTSIEDTEQLGHDLIALAAWRREKELGKRGLEE